MKKYIIISSLFLLIMLALCILNIRFLDRLTGEISDLLLKAHDCASSEDWQGAGQAASAARDTWRSYHNYLGIVLRNSEVSEITRELESLLCYAHNESVIEFEALATGTLAKIRSVQDIEYPAFWNVF